RIAPRPWRSWRSASRCRGPRASQNAGLGKSLHKAGNADLIAHLGKLAGAPWPHQVASPCISRDDLFGPSEPLRVTPPHHGERTILCTGLAARHGGIDGIEAAVTGCGMKLASDLGRRRGVIDEHRVLRDPVKSAILSEGDLAKVVIVADTGHDEILTLGGGQGGGGGTPAELRHPFLGLGCGAIVHGNIVTTLGLEMTRHRVTHHAEPEKRYLCHESSSLRPPLLDTSQTKSRR